MLASWPPVAGRLDGAGVELGAPADVPAAAAGPGGRRWRTRSRRRRRWMAASSCSAPRRGRGQLAVCGWWRRGGRWRGSGPGRGPGTRPPWRRTAGPSRPRQLWRFWRGGGGWRWWCAATVPGRGRSRRRRRCSRSSRGTAAVPRAGSVCLWRWPQDRRRPCRQSDGFAAGTAAGGPAAGQLAAGVHGAEGGGGEGGEHARVRGDGVGDAFAAGQPGADELVGVAAVGLGAGRADRGAAVPARDVEHLVGQGVGVEGADDLAGSGVEVADGAVQPDRAGAAVGGGGAGQPGVVVGRGWRGRAAGR